MENNQHELEMHEHKVRKTAMVLRAINHPLRQKMILLLHENKRMTVTDIYTKLNLEQSVASQHLAVLRRENFVITEREAKYIFYSVNYQRIKEVHQFASNILHKDELMPNLS